MLENTDKPKENTCVFNLPVYACIDKMWYYATFVFLT